MESSNRQNNKVKNIGLSILAGLGYAISALVVGIVIEFMILYLMVQFWDPGESGFFIIAFYLFPIVAVLSIVAGVRGGRRKYKRFSGNE